MKALRCWVAGLLLCLAGTGLAGPVTVQGVRLWAAPDNTRVVLDVSGPVQHELFSLSGPERVVIDLRDARLASGVDTGGAQGLVRSLRSGVRNGTDLRLVLDLKGSVKPRSFLLQPNAEYGHRLVIDLYAAAPVAAGAPVAATAAASKAAPEPVKSARAAPAGRDLVIAIDAGHGGEDPGARGPSGTREKDVVLSIARKLAALVEKEPGMRPVLIRDGDYFIRLRDRMNRARDQRADLFVSIHADAFHDRRARGSSVFVVSERGATSEMARILADQENAADLVGGVSLNDKDDLLKTVLLDLSKSASIEASMSVAGNVLGELKQVGRVHKRQVQQAGFMVLKSPDVPSILVETAFISNPEEERMLRDARHQQRLAQAVMNGIRAYFRNNPPPGTLVATAAAREHVVQRGDTLSEIAKRYDVSMQRLRVANGLSGDTLRIGGVLRIPGEDS
ncbi:MAG: N-acetylmuramoyl-L-alanine amidase [Gammaproteobacteria bacterium]